MDEVIDNLFVGSANSASSIIHFSLVVNCTRDIPFPKYETKCLRIPVDDSPDNAEYFIEYMNKTCVLEQIHESLINNQRVLVHCYAGINRSCSVIACYLMKYRNMTAKESIHFLQTRHCDAFYGISNNHIVSAFAPLNM
jgi:predicted protein tyrosine phosphatase